MGNFNKGGFGGGKRFGGKGGDRGGSRGGFGGGRGGDRERPDMHRATCDECGKSCEVPFRPSGDKPVFCSECFETKRDGGGTQDRGNRNFDSRDSRDSRDSKPRFSDRRPSQSEGVRETENLKPQLAQINETLTKILKALSSSTTSVPEVKIDRHEKAPRKEVDKVELKNTIEKAMETKTPAKKTAPKKTVTTPAKKAVAKVAPKKVAPKKVVAKKAVPAKKAVAKKK